MWSPRERWVRRAVGWGWAGRLARVIAPALWRGLVLRRVLIHHRRLLAEQDAQHAVAPPRQWRAGLQHLLLCLVPELLVRVWRSVAQRGCLGRVERAGREQLAPAA